MANYPRKLIICEGLVVIYLLASRTITKTPFQSLTFLQSVQMGSFLLSMVLKIILDRLVQPETKHQSDPVKFLNRYKLIKNQKKPKNQNKKRFIDCTGFYNRAFRYLF